MKRKTVWAVLFTLVLGLLLCACGSRDSAAPASDDGGKAGAADEELFVWDNNTIIGLTDNGKKQTSLTIPARCEGFSGAVFTESSVQNVVFEDDDDIALDLCFFNTKTLKSVDLPDGLTVIGSMAFQGCDHLESVVLPAALSTLDSYAFEACAGLKTVEFSGTSLAVIGENCFEECAALERVVIPEGVESIEKYAFSNCAALAEVQLPESLKTIDRFAFGGTALEELTIPAGLEFSRVDANAFGMNTYYMTVHVTAGSWADLNRDAWDVEFGEIVAD